MSITILAFNGIKELRLSLISGSQARCFVGAVSQGVSADWAVCPKILPVGPSMSGIALQQLVVRLSGSVHGVFG